MSNSPGDPVKAAKAWKKFLKEEKKEEKKELEKKPRTFSFIEMFLILMFASSFVGPIQKIILDLLWTKVFPH